MEPHPTSGFEWSYRDVLWTLTVAFMALAALALTQVPNPKAKASPVGLLTVSLEWDTTSDADIDLWVSAPEDKPVGFERRTGAVWDLLHDHRGHHVEGNFNNTEIAAARKLPAGKYTVNATAYNAWDGHLPVHVTATVSRSQPSGSDVKLFRWEGDLVALQQELTLGSFRLDETGALIPGSETHEQICLWRVC